MLYNEDCMLNIFSKMYTARRLKAVFFTEIIFSLSASVNDNKELVKISVKTNPRLIPIINFKRGGSFSLHSLIRFMLTKVLYVENQFMSSTMKGMQIVLQNADVI